MSNILPSSTAIRKQKGRMLAQFDAEQKMLNSGPLGSNRLLINVAIDFQEKYPHMSWEDCLRLAYGYCDRVHGN
jgi:hypothetical protein